MSHKTRKLSQFFELIARAIQAVLLVYERKRSKIFTFKNQYLFRGGLVNEVCFRFQEIAISRIRRGGINRPENIIAQASFIYSVAAVGPDHYRAFAQVLREIFGETGQVCCVINIVTISP
jgi:hypothetical protein